MAIRNSNDPLGMFVPAIGAYILSQKPLSRKGATAQRKKLIFGFGFRGAVAPVREKTNSDLQSDVVVTV